MRSPTIILQRLVEDDSLVPPFEDLPEEWKNHDLGTFSRSKELWNFQREALRNAIKALYLYFEVCRGDKQQLFQKYINAGYSQKYFNLKNKRELLSLVQKYYPAQGNKVEAHHRINQASFWMATGSGKTLVLVKLIEILHRLMEEGVIPRRQILVLTYRDDLIDQIYEHIQEFNELAQSRGLYIDFRSLKEYEHVQRNSLIPFFKGAETVFYYRSDLLDDGSRVSKNGGNSKPADSAKYIDFRSIENNGEWYIILDEAHKGDKQDSKRQWIYSILSKNGFLFNFSATFTDIFDIATAVYNYSLPVFINNGFGKHILLPQSGISWPEGVNDFTTRQKHRIVLKALILLSCLRRLKGQLQSLAQPITGSNVYHDPLLVVFAESVFTKKGSTQANPDLVEFFKVLADIGSNSISKQDFNAAKNGLLQDLSNNVPIFEDSATLDFSQLISCVQNITYADVLQYVYNAHTPGQIDVIINENQRMEAIFQLKSAQEPFAIIKIGNAVKWVEMNSQLFGSITYRSYTTSSIFDDLEKHSEISILLGSRAFYEGWDTNRPNITMFINLGKNVEAQKLVTQSIGRGVRIAPLSGKRKRLRFLANAGQDMGLYSKLGNHADSLIDPIETLFVYGTNRRVIENILSGVAEAAKLTPKRVALKRNNKQLQGKILLIPVYKNRVALSAALALGNMPLPQLPMIHLSQTDFSTLRKYITSTDPVVLLFRHDLSSSEQKLLQKLLRSSSYTIVNSGGQSVPDMGLDLVLAVVRRYLQQDVELIDPSDPVKYLQDEIVHFTKIAVLMDGPDLKKFEQVLQQVTSGALSSTVFKDLDLIHIAEHYYLPVIMSRKGKLEYIRHIIDVESEYEFVNDLITFLGNTGVDSAPDWWMFSKIDEHLDNVYIPYFDPNSNTMRRFKPDFIFWIKRGNDYRIVFVDPKSTNFTNYQHKVDWYKKLFENNGQPKVFQVSMGGQTYSVSVKLFLYSNNSANVPQLYQKYWIDRNTIWKIFQ